MPFDTIIFDLDGTLVDTADDLTASLNHALVALGREPVPPRDVRAMVGHGARRLLERGLSASGRCDDELVEQGLPLFLDYYAANIMAYSRPFEGVEATLDSLADRGFKLAVCTNKPAALTKRLIEALGWQDRFTAVLGADSRPWRKPDPRHLIDTLAAAGGERAIFVGDSGTDADTALAAGVPLVLVSFGYSTEPVGDMGADVLIDRFDALLPAIETIQHRFNGIAAPT